MKFKYSLIGDNTQDNREWLEKLGYKLSYVYQQDGVLYTSVSGLCYVGLIENIRVEDCIDCRSNHLLFQAVTAVREDSDRWQWYTDGKIWMFSRGK